MVLREKQTTTKPPAVIKEYFKRLKAQNVYYSKYIFKSRIETRVTVQQSPGKPPAPGHRIHTKNKKASMAPAILKKPKGVKRPTSQCHLCFKLLSN